MNTKIKKHTKNALLKSHYSNIDEYEKLLPSNYVELMNGILILDEERRIIFINPEAKKILSRTTPIEIGSKFFFKDQNPLKNKIGVGGKTKKDDEIEINISKFSVSEDTFYLIRVSCLTELIKSIGNLCKIIEMRKCAMEVADLGIWEYDYKKDTTFFDSTYANILGFSNKEFTEGKFIEVLNQKDQEKVLGAWNQLLLGNSQIYRSEFRSKTKSGEWRWIQARAKAIKTDLNEKPYRFVGTNQDITNKKQAELELNILYKGTSIVSENINLKEKIKKIIDLVFKEYDLSFICALIFNDQDNSIVFDVSKSFQTKNIKSCHWNLAGQKIILEKFINDMTPYLKIGFDEITLCKNIPLKLNKIGYAFPIIEDKKITGILVVFSDELLKIDEIENKIFTNVSGLIGMALEKENINKMLRDIVKLEERHRLARELHDTINQSLFSISLMINGCKDYTKNGEINNVAKILESMQDAIFQTQNDMRLLIYELKPSVLGQEGIIKALQNRLDVLEKNFQIKTNLIIDYIPNFTEEIEKELFGIVQEALNNVIKHSNATKIDVRLYKKNRKVYFYIKDNGLGFNKRKTVDGYSMGLSNMSDRANRVGGKFFISSKSGKGTKIIVSLPA